MTTPGIPQEKTTSGAFESRVVIVAEIAFAALLLYLTNHPINVNDLTQADATVDAGLTTIAEAASSTDGAPDLAVEFATPTAGVELASTTINSADPLINN